MITGKIVLSRSPDGLLHFKWVNLINNAIEGDDDDDSDDDGDDENDDNDENDDDDDDESDDESDDDYDDDKYDVDVHDNYNNDDTGVLLVVFITLT